MGIKEWKMEGRREDNEEGEDKRESCHFRYRINLFTGAGLCGGVGGDSGGRTGSMGIRD